MQRLPLELLAEILKFSSSITVLAVARTCKWLCETLTHKDQEFIWKAARSNYFGEKLPDPPPGLPEPAYASAIFDVGNCLNCGCPWPNPPRIFYFGHRICFKDECRRSVKRYFTSTLVVPDEVDKEIFGGLLPQALYRWHMDIDVEGITYSRAAYRIKDFTEFLRLWRASEGDPQGRDGIIKRLITRQLRNAPYYKHQRQYSKWFQLWIHLETYFKEGNSTFIRAIANKSGWVLEDLVNAPTLKSLMDACKRERDMLTDTWWRVYEPEIAKEVGTLAEIRTRRSEERARVQRQEDIEKLWQSLRQLRPYEGCYSVPPFNIFLSLPFIRNVERTNISDLGARFGDGPTFQALLHTEISAWRHGTQKALATALGYKKIGGKTKSGSEHYKDQREFLDRATSLFECSKCWRTGPISMQLTTMTHGAVVVHRCPKGTTATHVDPITGEERTKENRDWNVNNFVPDKVAIAAVRLALSLADPPFDESTSISTVVSDERLASFPRYACLTCPSRITMNIGEIPGHAKRHKALFEASAQKNPSGLDGKIGLELGWVATEPVTKDGLSIRSDIYRHTEQLMSNTPSGKRKCALREYACRHCEFSLTNTSRAPRLFTVDGLHSHLKASHGIYPLRNEDFCHVPKLSYPNLERTQQSEETAIVSCQPRSDVAVVGRARTSSNDPKLWTADQLVVDEGDS